MCIFSEGVGAAEEPAIVILNIFIFNGVKATAMGSSEGGAAPTYGRALRVIWGRTSAGHVSTSINPVPSVCLLLFLQPPGSGSGRESVWRAPPTPNSHKVLPLMRGRVEEVDHQTRSKALTFFPPLSKSTAAV